MRKNDCAIEDESILDCDIYRAVVLANEKLIVGVNQEFAKLSFYKQIIMFYYIYSFK